MTVGSRSHKYLTGYRKTLSVRVNPPATSGTTSLGTPVTFSESWNGGDDPFHKSKIALGISCTNTLSKSVYRMTARNPLMVISHGWDEYQPATQILIGRNSDIVSFDPFSVTDYAVSAPSYPTQLAALRTEVGGRFYHRASELLSPFSGGVFTGELAETIRFLVSPARSLRELIVDYVYRTRHILKRTPNVAKRLNQTYLEFTYAAKPLVADIQAARDVLIRQQALTRPVRVTKSVNFNAVYARTDNVALNQCRYRKTVVSQAEVKVKCRGRVRCIPVNGVYPYWQEWGLSKENFIPTAWNVLPWSFVLGYFFNIENVLESYGFRMSNLIYSSTTEVSRNHKLMHAEGYVNRLNTITTKSKSASATISRPGRVERLTVNRYAGVSLPGVQFTVPGSLAKFNIASLIIQSRLNVKKPHFPRRKHRPSGGQYVTGL